MIGYKTKAGIEGSTVVKIQGGHYQTYQLDSKNISSAKAWKNVYPDGVIVEANSKVNIM